VNDGKIFTQGFITKLKQAPPNFCPKPKQKIIKKSSDYSVSGKWLVTTKCEDNKTVRGNAIIRLSEKTQDKSIRNSVEKYIITYQNEFGDKGTGSLQHTRPSNWASLSLYLRGERAHYTLLRKKSGDWRSNSGSCEITFTK